MIRVRDEVASDRDAVYRIEEAAFGRRDEADLVERLRVSVDPILSLVAEREGRLVGHVCFSPVRLEPDAAEFHCAGLGPLAVAPGEQRHGVGSALVRAGLERCRGLGWRGVFLLGDPAYYSRFGFALAAPRGLRYESPDFDGGFQVLELTPGALSGCSGWVRYAEAFSSTASR